ncbi:type II secretion system protein GspK [Thermomonas sp.]|uniref:general secretion pathway protein GspK n=1 Tax=Thermomonas sp. TaxID=1971895 RepID=UPI00248722E6|nr:type II secretion system protein GspK [Thermomonas sp.]MDI1254198.1 type II secretion system protein GspK [Thermomonas sp.]
MGAAMRGRMRKHSGFVLIAVLAVLVILSVLASVIGVITQRLRDEQIVHERQLREQIAMASTRATVLYLLTSQRMTFGGLTVDDRIVLSEDERLSQRNGDEQLSYMPVGNEVALDSSAHQGLDGTRFSLQDDRGLLAINWAPPALLANYVQAVRNGPKPAARPFETLFNLLQDYQDPDDLYRLNSAERSEYERLGRSPPSNRTLSTPMELRRVIGWDKALAGISDKDLNDSLTVVRSAQINVNTAPARVLQTLPGVDASMAQRAVAARTLTPFTSLTAFYGVAGAIPVNEDLLALYPMASGTLKLWSPEGGAVMVLHWTLTPRDDGGRPWREDYEFIHLGDETAKQGMARPVAAKVFAEPHAAPQ